MYNLGQGSFRPTWQVDGPNGKKAQAFIEPYVYGAHGSFQASKDAQGPLTSAAIAPGGTRAGFHLWSRDNGDTCFDIQRGEWNEVKLHVKLNDVGKANGVARVTINGCTRELNDVSFRERKDTLIQSVALECFFGGSSKYHMTPGYKQSLEFKDVMVSG